MMNEELRSIYLADQAERGEEHLEPGIAGRDEVRRHRVQELLSAGEVHTAEDFFHAAMVFQHGRDVEDYRLAGELAATRTPRQAAHPQAQEVEATCYHRCGSYLSEPLTRTGTRMAPIFTGAVVAVVTAALLSIVAWALGRGSFWLRPVSAAVLSMAVVVAGMPGVAAADALGNDLWIQGHHTYVTNTGGCLFAKADPFGLHVGLDTDPGALRLASYGSIDWVSGRTPCGNTGKKIQGGDFYIVQVLRSWNSSTNAWDVCNWGPQVWNPGPFSHDTATDYTWQQTPCPHGQGNWYSFQMSIADRFGAGYGTWAYAEYRYGYPGQTFVNPNVGCHC